MLKFAGFQKLYGLDEEDDASESRLPEVTEGTPLTVSETAIAEEGPPVRPEQHFTQPPPRYTEASLVKTLEEENIGRPSTYATIVGTITGRDYVSRDKGRLAPTDLGMAVNRLLVESFPDVFNVKFTASMEEELDEIEEGKQEWHHVVNDFWGPFSKDLEQAEKSSQHHRKKVEETTDIACPTCGRMLVRKFGRRGPFLACPGYPECKYTRPVDDAELPTPVPGACELCGSPLVARTGPSAASSPAPSDPIASSPSHSPWESPARSAARERSPSGAPSAARCSSAARATRNAPSRCGTGRA